MRERGTKGALTGEEIGIAEVQRGSHQSADIDLCALAEQDAVRVEQPHLAVGVELAEYPAGISAQHAVERDGGSVGLDEINALVRADVEALPVHSEILRGLAHRHGAAVPAYGSATRRYLPVTGQGVGGNAEHAKHRHRGDTRANVLGLALGTGVFGNGDPSADGSVVDRTVDVVHAGELRFKYSGALCLRTGTGITPQ